MARLAEVPVEGQAQQLGRLHTREQLVDVWKELEPTSAVDEGDVVPVRAQLESCGEARKTTAQNENTLSLFQRTLHWDHHGPRGVYGADDSGAPFRRLRS